MSIRPNPEGPGPPFPRDRRPWTTLADASRDVGHDAKPTSRRRVLTAVFVGSALILALVGISGSVAAGRLSEKETVHDAAKNAALLADAVVQPALRDNLASGDPQAFAAIDRVVRKRVLGRSSVRVKIWTPEGKIVYSDEPALVGRRFPLGAEERDVFTHPVTHAEVSDLQRPENAYERGQGKLLEVYRPVWTPSGDPLLFETYARYNGVTSRSTLLWRGFAGITLTSLLALIVLLVPVVWRLLSKVQEAQAQREALLERAVEASTDERRRIAGTLHDGVIQDLAGASLIVNGASARAAAAGQQELADQLREAAATVRRGITGMRTLLVDIYPPNLETSGLVVALEDVAVGLHSRDIDVSTDLDPLSVTQLTAEDERLFYRVAHECVHNTMKHASADCVTIALRRDGDATVLDINDNGCGFDARRMLANPEGRHFGLRVLSDVAREAGALLGVASAPGEGTRWYLRVEGGRQQPVTPSPLRAVVVAAK